MRPLDQELLRGAHTRRELAAGGVGDGELRGPLWVRTNQGLWAWAGSEVGGGLSPSERIRRVAPLTGDRGALGGWAAAHLLGHVELDGVGPGETVLPVPLCLPPSMRCRRTRDVRVVRSDFGEDEVTIVDGVRVTDRVRTAADLIRFTRPLGRAVMALDIMLRNEDPRGYPTRPDGPDGAPSAALAGELAGWLHTHHGWRGIGAARRALDLARAGVESPQESRTRMVWVLEAGLPMPGVQVEVYHLDGRFLGRADMMDRDAGVVTEFDGGYHAGADRRARDHVRREGFQDAGLIVLQFTAVDLGRARARTVARMRSAHAQGMARDRRLDRWMVGSAA
ncbi:MAG: hypothetical protein U0Q19_05155 [Kineosporiaceae bacterium]